MAKQTPDGTPVVHVTQIHKGCGSGCGQGIGIVFLIVILLALAKSCDTAKEKPAVSPTDSPSPVALSSYVRLTKAVQFSDGDNQREIPAGTRLQVIGRSGDTLQARYERWAVVLPKDAFKAD